MYKNRTDAGKLLAKHVARLKLDPLTSVIAAIPRGGVAVGAEIANKLKIPLSVLVVKKLGAPNNPELAIGATASFGTPVLDQWLIRQLNVSKDYLHGELLNKKREAKNREDFLGVQFKPSMFCDKNVIVVDDGIATGQTVKAVARIAKKFKPKKLILAVGCASPSVLESLKEDYDEIVCPVVTEDFMAVGQFYEDFRQVEDEEVKLILATSK